MGRAEGAVDGSGFGHAHLGVVENQGRNIAGMGFPVAGEPTAFGRFIDRGLEDPAVLLGAAQRQQRLDLDARAMVGFRQVEQLGMSDVKLCLLRVRSPIGKCAQSLLLLCNANVTHSAVHVKRKIPKPAFGICLVDPRNVLV